MFMFCWESLKTCVETGEGAFDGVILRGTMDSVLNDINGFVAAHMGAQGDRGYSDDRTTRPGDLDC